MNRAILLAGAALLVASCKTPEQQEPPPKPFVGTHWQVVLDLPLKGEQPNMRFGDGRVVGFAGCSDFTAPYLSDSMGAGTLVIRKIEMDKRLCDAGTRAVEDHLIEQLKGVQSYKILGDAMVMPGTGGEIKLIAVP
ncbi:MAG TPA: META domain-containing protein [Usitatibacter sp.]|nr:META domain-containing protein [Usitatibacter sp.]